MQHKTGTSWLTDSESRPHTTRTGDRQATTTRCPTGNNTPHSPRQHPQLSNVTLALSLAMTKAQFDAVQSQLISQVASAAGVSASDVTVVVEEVWDRR